MRKTLGVLMFSIPAFAKTPHAPLPPEAYSAKTIAIVNHTETQKVVDKAYEELTKWGRLKIIQSPADADMVLVVDVDKEIHGATANTYGSTTRVNEHTVVTITTAFILKGQTEPFFSEQERANLFRKSATQRGIDDLKSRIDEGPPAP